MLLWSLLWLVNGLPCSSLPPPHLKKGRMRLKNKWLKTKPRTSFRSFKMCRKDIVTVTKQVFLITTNIRDQLCFTSLKKFLINFSELVFRYWYWFLWHILLYSMSYLQWKTIYSLMFSFLTFSSSKSVVDGLAHCGLNYTESTDKFIRMCDHFFDCLNVCNTLEGQMKRNLALEPYIDRIDWRIKVFLIF